MSTAETWDLRVPEDAADLAAELRRHGVRPGEHVWVVATQRLTDDAELRRFRNALAHIGSPERVSELTEQLQRLTRQEVKDTPQREELLAFIAVMTLLGREHIPAASDREPQPPRRRRRLSFIGAGEGGPSDVSERTDEYLSRGFGRA